MHSLSLWQPGYFKKTIWLAHASFKEAPMKIAVMGTRGIPARHGGFENFAEEL
jgi:hypothetical protein